MSTATRTAHTTRDISRIICPWPSWPCGRPGRSGQSSRGTRRVTGVGWTRRCTTPRILRASSRMPSGRLMRTGRCWRSSTGNSRAWERGGPSRPGCRGSSAAGSASPFTRSFAWPTGSGSTSLPRSPRDSRTSRARVPTPRSRRWPTRRRRPTNRCCRRRDPRSPSRSSNATTRRSPRARWRGGWWCSPTIGVASRSWVLACSTTRTISSPSTWSREPMPWECAPMRLAFPRTGC